MIGVIIMNVPSPCKQDCPNRNAHCRVNCVKHKIYVAVRNKEYEKRQEEREKAALEYEYRVRTFKRMSY